MTKSTVSASEIEIDVTWEDQRRINTFGRLATRVTELDEEIAKLREEINRINDATDEIILTDDIKFLVGEVFIDVDNDNAEQMLESEKKRLEKSIRTKEGELKRIQETAKQIKGIHFLFFSHA
jgi:prefoldin subunit 4